MTVATNDSKYTYAGNGATTAFDGPKLFDASTLSVQQRVDATGVVSTLVQDVDYTVTGVGLAQSTVTFTTAPPSGVTVLLKRVLPYEQQTNITNQGAYYPETIEDQFDRDVMLAQQIEETLGRSITTDDFDDHYLANSKRITEVADGVAATDVATKGQMDVAVAAAAGGVLPTDIALYSSLADSSPGNGSKLIAFIQRITGAVARWVEDKLGETISVKDFGATGDGVTDDTAAIQLALTNIPDGGTLLFPAGVYKVASTLTCSGKSINIRGKGMKSSIIAFSGSTTLFDIQPGNILRSVCISDMSLYASNPTVSSGTAISIVYPTTSSWTGKTATISNIEIRSNLSGPALPYWGRGIYLKDCWNSVIRNVWFNGKANDAATSSGFIEFDENCTDSLVTECHAYFCQNAVKQSGYGEGIRITDCTFVLVNRGFYNTSASLIGPWISECHINAVTFCVDLSGASQPLIQNCVLYTSYAGAVGNVHLSASSDGLVTGNHFFTNQASVSGVIIEQPTGSAARNRVTGNNFVAFAQAVWLKSGVSSNLVEGNDVFNGTSVAPTLLDNSSASNTLLKRVFAVSVVKTLTGGAATEVVDFTLPSNVLYTSATAAFLFDASGTQNIIGFYNHDDAANTSTNVRMTVRKVDGGAIGGGGVRFSLLVCE